MSNDIIIDLVRYQATGDYVRYALARAGISFTDEQVKEIYSFPYPREAVDLLVRVYYQSQQFQEAMEKIHTRVGHSPEHLDEVSQAILNMASDT